MSKIFTRMGDGSPAELTEAELMHDLEAGTEDAADRGNIPPLSNEELQHLFDVFSSPYTFVSVEPGKQVVLTYDGGPIKMIRTGVNVNRLQSLQIYEKLMGADTMELAHIDYSYKPVKPIVNWEQTLLEQALFLTIPPLFYDAMPNLGLYSQPDGPFPNPSELLPDGKIDEAKAFVADKFKVSVSDLTDPVIMGELRRDLQIGVIHPEPGDAKGIDAKFRISEILGIDINCVKRFKDKIQLST